MSDRSAILARRARLVALSLAGAGMALADQRPPRPPAAPGASSGRASGPASAPGSASAATRPRASASAEELAAAKELVQRGMAAAAEGNHAEAVALLERAYRIHPHPGLALRLAESHEALGRADRALPLYEEALGAAQLKPEQREQAARRLRDLHLTLARLRLKIASPFERVTLDDEPLDAPVDRVLWVLPGRHTVRVVWRESPQASSLLVELTAGHETTAEIDAPTSSLHPCLVAICLQPPPPPPPLRGGCGCSSPGANE